VPVITAPRAAAEVLPELEVTAPPETAFTVEPGQVEASLHLELSGEVPESGLTYTIERSDQEVWDGKVHRAHGDTSVDIPIPVGAANPELGPDKSATVQATITTAVGTYDVALRSALPVAGHYAGSVRMGVFGGVGLPIDFQIVTSPDDSALEDAEQAWLVLPVAATNLFSAIDAFSGAPEFISSELEFDSFLGQWVARFEYEFRLSDETLISSSEPGQIGRILRFEIEPFGTNQIVGSMSDRWEGFYDGRSAEGVIAPADVVFEGELELDRIGDALASSELPLMPTVAKARPDPMSAPPLDRCSDAAYFPEDPITVEGSDYTCGSIDSASAFSDTSVEAQAECAVAAAGAALAGETTGSQIAAFLDDSVENPGGMSFAEYMEACAEGRSGFCDPSPEVLCARQLLARAHFNQEQDTDITAQLVVSYQATTREAFLGRQLAAFKNDADMRLTWLRTTDYPAIVTNAVQDLNERLLSEWRSGVLDAHLEVLRGYFDASGLAILSRQPASDTTRDARNRLLSEMIQGWRGTLEAVTLAAQRYNDLVQDAPTRTEKADTIKTTMFDLYLLAGIATNLTRSSGAGYQATAFGAGFSELSRALGHLTRSFDDLVFARDAEVVVATSLDPENDNETLLGELQDTAEQEVDRAQEAVQTVLDESQAQLLRETQLANRMANEINDLRDELVQMCGLPVGCTAEDFRTTAECVVQVEAGTCGFSIERGSGDFLAFQAGQQNVSEAGRALLGILDASEAMRFAVAEVRSFEAKMSLELNALEAFASDIEQWNTQRLEGIAKLEELLDAKALLDAEGLEDLREALADKARTRQEQISRMRDDFSNWEKIRVEGYQSDFRKESQASIARLAATGLKALAGDTLYIAEVMADGLPKSVGTASDAMAPARLAIRTEATLRAKVMNVAATAAEGVASWLESEVEKDQVIRAATLERLDEQAELADAISEAEIQEIADELELNRALTAAEKSALQDAYDVAREQREAELAYARDMDELRQRRTAYLKMLQDRSGLELRAERASLGIEQRISEYLAVVQRAKLQFARWQDLEAQRTNVNQLVGSPAVVFARANRLAHAESRLELAKAKLMDWLVGLEYFAVRPFMDQRVQILLARNPYQLQDIASELARLEASCGGAVNQDSAVVSVRDDLMGVTLPVNDKVTSKQLFPEERFRQMLSEGYIPADKRIRYTSNSTVGDLLDYRDGRVLGITFDVGLDDFANLAATCNVKVDGISVRLVGAIGSGRPTVSVLYDGTSRLTSCQPGIEDYVELIGRELTNFGEVTLLKTPGRAISPLAGINTWREESNTSLAGLPLASQYTVLIDTELGENDKLDWSKLEDIQLKYDYVYSDLFPVGQCE